MFVIGIQRRGRSMYPITDDNRRRLKILKALHLQGRYPIHLTLSFDQSKSSASSLTSRTLSSAFTEGLEGELSRSSISGFLRASDPSWKSICQIEMRGVLMVIVSFG